MTTPDLNAIIEEVRQALLTTNRPLREDGWFSFKELQEITRDEDGSVMSQSQIHKQIAAQGDKWEKRKVKGYMYYRLRNGKP